MPPQKSLEVVNGVLKIFDQNADGVISRDEWLEGWRRGARLPDFGVGSPELLFRTVVTGEAGWGNQGPGRNREDGMKR